MISPLTTGRMMPPLTNGKKISHWQLGGWYPH
jgi:hypothetical protein